MLLIPVPETLGDIFRNRADVPVGPAEVTIM